MTQVHTVHSLSETLNTRVAYASLNDILSSVTGEGKPLTLRQVSNIGCYDIETVNTALQERTRRGTLASFKIGPLNYYASPQTVLTSKQPTFASFVCEVFRNTLWEGRRHFEAITEKVIDFAGR